MPKLFEPTLTEMVKTRFRSFNVALPTVVSGAPANIAQYLMQNPTTATATMSIAPRVTTTASIPLGKLATSTTPGQPAATPQSVPPALFRAASNNQADVNFQTQVSDEFSRYISGICHAIVGAHDKWRAGAFMKGVVINGGIARGGSISGPSLSDHVNLTGPQQGLFGNAAAYTRAIGDGLATAWRDWEQSVRVPNLPWYPAFSAWPAAQSPPVPNVPTPLGAMIWSTVTLSADNLRTQMSRKLPQGGPYSAELLTSIATGFSVVAGQWIGMQLVTGVMGRGPVPSFTPPYVPVGPVVGGSIIEAPPHFNT